MSDFSIKVDCLGFRTPTTVHIADDYITTSYKTVPMLCEIWREHFHIPKRRTVKLLMPKDIFQAIERKPFGDRVKSVRELFEERGFICVKHGR